MRNKIHTFETCVNCMRQHSVQTHLCASCDFELPRADLTAKTDEELSALSGRCLAYVLDRVRACGPDTMIRRHAAGLLVLADREMQRRRVATRDHGHRTIKPSVYALSSRP